MSKTPVSILQEMMVKLGQIPTYECINQTGPHHLATFEYRCVANGVSATATARSKKEAKQEAARGVLLALAPNAAPPPPPHLGLPSSSSGGDEDGGAGGAGAGEALPRHSHVALLKELCEEFRLGAVQYDVVGDTGPPHDRRFTMRAALGRHARVATAATKKLARQLAAEQLYSYLRQNLATATKDFVENCGPNIGKNLEQATDATATQDKESRKRKADIDENLDSKRSCDRDLGKLLQSACEQSEDALARALDKVMARYEEIKEDKPWKPDLGQRVADYHRGLSDTISEEQRRAAEEVIGKEDEEDEEELWAKLHAAARALGLSVEVEQLAGEGGALSVVTLSPSAPALALAGRRPRDAAAAALRYLRRSLALRPSAHSPMLSPALSPARTDALRLSEMV